MFQAPDSPYLVAPGEAVDMETLSTTPPASAPDRDRLKDQRKDSVEEMAELQRMLYADDRYGVLLVFQAMDAAGKDSTIRKVLTGVNPAGFQVSSFKAPSREELDHDFLWRSACRLPERGRIGVFNRSYYEEVLVVRVHPEFLEGQRLPAWGAESEAGGDTIWSERFRSIRDHELHLARNGFVVLKFFLHISLEEQGRRFLRRLDRPDKHWKFSAADLAEREQWPRYMEAYAEMLPATSRSWAPWYAIPADDKPFMRRTVAALIVRALRSLELRYPQPDPEERARFDEYRQRLTAEERPAE